MMIPFTGLTYEHNFQLVILFEAMDLYENGYTDIVCIIQSPAFTRQWYFIKYQTINKYILVQHQGDYTLYRQWGRDEYYKDSNLKKLKDYLGGEKKMYPNTQ